jgi:hypothetical protein
MAGRKHGGRAAKGALPEPRRENYKGHEIVYPTDERRNRFFIDGRPVRYGQAGDEYYLDVYAFDRAKTLEEVIRRYLDYKDRVREHGSKEQ